VKLVGLEGCSTADVGVRSVGALNDELQMARSIFLLDVIQCKSEM